MKKDLGCTGWIGRKIVWIACFAMMNVALQASPAQAGMIQNMLENLEQQPAPAAKPAPVSPPVDETPRRVMATPTRYKTPVIPAQELAPLDSPITSKIDQIVVYKAKRLMELRSHGQVMRHYRIALGRNPIGHKLYQGDNRTPEGRYRIDMRNANSNYFRSLRISYPDTTDQDVALTVGLRPGDWIMIHGLKNGYTAKQLGHPNRDWTNGCIALTNSEMAEVWNLVDVGTPITIYP